MKKYKPYEKPNYDLAGKVVVRKNTDNTKVIIAVYDDNTYAISDHKVTAGALFDDYTFKDGSPCGEEDTLTKDEVIDTILSILRPILIKQHYKELCIEVRKQSSVLQYDLHKIAALKSYSEIIAAIIIWRYTKQGVDYWSDISSALAQGNYDKLYKNKVEFVHDEVYLVRCQGTTVWLPRHFAYVDLLGVPYFYMNGESALTSCGGVDSFYQVTSYSKELLSTSKAADHVLYSK